MITFDEASLRRTLRSYFRYYRRSRLHPSLDNDSPEPRLVQSIGKVIAIPEVGDLHNRYEWRASLSLSAIEQPYRPTRRVWINPRLLYLRSKRGASENRMLHSSRSLSFRPRWNIQESLAMRFLVGTLVKPSKDGHMATHSFGGFVSCSSSRSLK